MSYSLDPDQAQKNVGPDLGPYYLQKLSADDTSRKTVKNVNIFHPLFFDKMSFIRTEGHKILVRITKRKDPDQTVSSLAAMFLQKVK